MVNMSLRDRVIGNLRRFRRSAHLSQMQLAEKCGISTNYLAEIETGRKFPSIEMVEKLADALKVEPYKLFQEEHPKQEPSPEQRMMAYMQLVNQEGREEFLKAVTDSVTKSVVEALQKRPPSPYRI
jgi:transcriptional regulator with XRE-family HTH domain